MMDMEEMAEALEAVAMDNQALRGALGIVTGERDLARVAGREIMDRNPNAWERMGEPETWARWARAFGWTGQPDKKNGVGG